MKFFIKKIQAEDISILIINELWGDLYLFLLGFVIFYKKRYKLEVGIMKQNTGDVNVSPVLLLSIKEIDVNYRIRVPLLC